VIPDFTDDTGKLLAVSVAEACGAAIISVAPSTRYADTYDMRVTGSLDDIDTLAMNFGYSPAEIDGLAVTYGVVEQADRR
jgi:hypothetical protein